jgi:hypothetical protein
MNPEVQEALRVAERTVVWARVTIAPFGKGGT